MPIDGSCSNATEVRTLSRMVHKPIRRCSVHHSRSQIPTVMAMTITADSLLPRSKCDCDGSYDMAVKGPNVVMRRHSMNSSKVSPYHFPLRRRQCTCSPRAGAISWAQLCLTLIPTLGRFVMKCHGHIVLNFVVVWLVFLTCWCLASEEGNTFVLKNFSSS